jgi:hypothetical protein
MPSLCPTPASVKVLGRFGKQLHPKWQWSPRMWVRDYEIVKVMHVHGDFWPFPISRVCVIDFVLPVK